MSSKGNKSATPKVQPNVSAEPAPQANIPQATETDTDRKDGAVEKDDSEFVSPVISEQNAETVEPSTSVELPSAPQANIPQATEVPTSNNGMMTLLNRHGQPTDLPEKTALFLLKKYPSRYSPIN